MPYFENEKASIYYEVHGEGPAIIFTHGASWDHNNWKPQIEYFKTHYKCIIWDIRGHGKSTLAESELTEELFISDFLELFKVCNIKKATLVGLSLGGILSSRIAATHKDKVESLILIGTIYSFTATIIEKLLIPINRWYYKKGNFKTAVKMTRKAFSKFNKAAGEYAGKCMEDLGQERFSKLWDCITRINNKKLIHDIEARTLILHGNKDSTTSRQQKYLRDNIMNSEFRTIKNAFHGTNLDNSSDVNNYMNLFLSNDGGINGY